MSDTRGRIIAATTTLFMQRGYAGSGLKLISEASASPVGSLYHHFPGGKAELAAEVLAVSGQAYQELVEAALDSQADLVEGIRACFAGAAQVLRASDYADACPIATVALEVASSDESLRLVTAAVFGRWLASLGARLVAGGVAPDRAEALATVVLAGLEGGFLLSRVAKDATAMEVIGHAVAELVAAALDT